ncbi:MAG: cobalamin-dependent protein [Candidatus Liptonbacteria bacterium]|nr:cobalamin-dependent protein [Candidatus Liptonbacteria bacterium]
MAKRRKVVLVKADSHIEPYGLMCLAGDARDCGWDCSILLQKGYDFEEVLKEAAGADLVGFSVWSGTHKESFAAADAVRKLGVRVAIGGPHVTYHEDDCIEHADIVAKSSGFRIFHYLMAGGEFPKTVQETKPRLFFDTEPRTALFPIPDRNPVYERYPHLKHSDVVSMIGEEGCPFHCTYCDEPARNKEHGGFKNIYHTRPVNDLIVEAKTILAMGLSPMIYWQDDVFGFNVEDWLKELSERWPSEVGLKFHVQMRLELLQGAIGKRRLELLRNGGCSGITCAIESGNDFLRQFVLKRGMGQELILEGAELMKRFGFPFRFESMLQMPFSDRESDFQTLQLNYDAGATMAWNSHYTPFGGEAETMSRNLRMFEGNSDDFAADFYWDRSLLHHVRGGSAGIEPYVRAIVALEKSPRFDSPITRMRAEPKGGNIFGIYYDSPGVVSLGPPKPICELEYLDPATNDRYIRETAFWQRIFMWSARVPEGPKLARAFANLPDGAHTWKNFGVLTNAHLTGLGLRDKMMAWQRKLAKDLNVPVDQLPAGVRENPYYPVFLASSAQFAREMCEKGVFANTDPQKLFDEISRETRRAIFRREVYQTEPATKAIAEQTQSELEE